MIKIHAPDGSVIEFPEGTSETTIKSVMRSAYPAPVPVPSPAAGSEASTLQEADLFAGGLTGAIADTAGAIPDLVGSGLRAVGLPSPPPGAYTKAIRGGLQDVSRAVTAPFTDQQSIEAVTPRQKAIQGAGRGVGQAMGVFAPAAGLARVAGAVGPVTQGVTKALAAQPVLQSAAGAVGGGVAGGTDSEIAGFLASLATGGVPAMARRAITPFPSQVGAEGRRLGRVAQREGIELTPGQVTGSPALQTMENTFRQLPLTSRSQNRIFDAQRKGFNRAVMRRAGVDADNVSPGVMDDAYTNIGREFDDLAARTRVPADPQFFDDIAARAAEYQRRLNPDQSRVVQSYVDDLTSMRGPMQAGQNPVIEGREYQTLISDIRKRARQTSDTNLKSALRGIADDLDGALERAGGSELRDSWRDVRNRYRNLKTIEKASLGGTAADQTSGDIPYGALRSAVRGSDKTGFARGRGDLNDLSRLGSRLGSTVPPDSGTNRRINMTQMLQAGQMGGVGGGGFGAATGMIDPVQAATVAAVAAGLPKGVQSIYNSPMVRRYLTNQLAQDVRRQSALPAIALGQFPGER